MVSDPPITLYRTNSIAGTLSRSESHPFMSANHKKWQTLAELDLDRLKKETAIIRPGSSFVVDMSKGDVSDRTDAGINIHVRINFETGEEWLLRIPSFAERPEPATMVSQVCMSEVLTYKALKAAGVAVPEVYGWGLGTVSKTASEFQFLITLFFLFPSLISMLSFLSSAE
jgi:hypothetical protein